MYESHLVLFLLQFDAGILAHYIVCPFASTHTYVRTYMPQPTCLVWTSCIRSSSSARSSLSWVWCSFRVSLSTCISSPSRRTLSLSRSDCNFSTTLMLWHKSHRNMYIHIPLLLHQNTLHCIYIYGVLACKYTCTCHQLYICTFGVPPAASAAPDHPQTHLHTA